MANIRTLTEAAEQNIEVHILADRIERHYCQCTGCRQATTVDFRVIVWEYHWYSIRTERDVWEPRTTYYRLDHESQAEVRSTYIKQCPRCGKASPRNSQLKASKVRLKPDALCDDRCQTATSDSCLCSCNGANHGAKNKIHDGLWS